MRIPKDIEQKVVRQLYADAMELEWASLTPQQHSAQYAMWVSDGDVGGRLREYLSDAEARVWIKDGPMKEWSRSLSGVGKYAEFVEDAGDVPTKLVRRALGSGWEADHSTIRSKPLRVLARNGEEETVVTWAAPKDLKHLVWAALTADAEGDSRPWVVCVIETFTKPTPANERNAQLRLAKRCGLKLVYVTL
ncbi:hypothetical protein [Segeticoccus rhizosphaerae]|uniref:hypothetical protein n=1 Tax=Segeticoccus rhizosphaerae TaxID=1104777 RepID=UPI0010C00851|nr:hypothetical protein [Ornithinicoccus soli]